MFPLRKGRELAKSGRNAVPWWSTCMRLYEALKLIPKTSRREGHGEEKKELAKVAKHFLMKTDTLTEVTTTLFL